MVIYKLYSEGFSMNMSRIALLSTVFCATAMFASETPFATAAAIASCTCETVGSRLVSATRGGGVERTAVGGMAGGQSILVIYPVL